MAVLHFHEKKNTKIMLFHKYVVIFLTVMSSPFTNMSKLLPRKVKMFAFVFKKAFLFGIFAWFWFSFRRRDGGDCCQGQTLKLHVDLFNGKVTIIVISFFLSNCCWHHKLCPQMIFYLSFLPFYAYEMIFSIFSKFLW